MAGPVPFVSVALRWEYLDAAGRTLGRSEPFAERSAAEGWMGQAWEELAQQGVEEVVLRDEDTALTVYRMALGSD